jgi:O-antigen ligase
LNSQIVIIDNALKSKTIFNLLSTCIPVTLFLSAGFISIAVIWFVAICFYNYSFSQQFRPKYLLLLPVFFYLIYVFGLTYSQDLEVAITIVVRKIHILILPLAFFIANRAVSEKNLNYILGFFLGANLISGVVCLVYALYSAATAENYGIALEGEMYSFFSSYLFVRPLNVSPVYISLYYNFSLLVALSTPFIRITAYRVVIAVYLLVLIILLGSHVGLVSSSLIFLFWLTGRLQNIKLIGAVMVILVVIAIVTATSNDNLKTWVIRGFDFNYTEDFSKVAKSQSNKVDIWNAALKKIEEAPTLGFGPGDGQKALEQSFLASGLKNEFKDALNAHNEFLSTSLEIGMCGLAVMIIMLVVPLVHAVRAKNLTGIGFLLIIILFFSIESVLTRQKGIVFFSFFYSLLFHTTMKRTPTNS